MNGKNGKGLLIGGTRMNQVIEDSRNRTTIGLRSNTKVRLDSNRAPGQCYDGFISQLVDLWEITNGKQ